MTYHGESAKNTTGHAEPRSYTCPGCALMISVGEEIPIDWTERVAMVRAHLVSEHGWHHLPPSSDGTTWYFPEDYPK